MELGEKLRQARLAAGLSQRQLCGGEITRNMLSQIEHGTCNPSMATLRYLAAQLGQPVSYFLEEDSTPNVRCMEEAWLAFEAGDRARAVRLLEAYRAPDPVFDREYRLLKALSLLGLAEESAAAHRQVYARKLLSQVRALEGEVPWLPQLGQRRQLLEFQLGTVPAETQLPGLDDRLLMHAAAALEAGRVQKAAALLDACDDRQTAQWCLLRAKAYLAETEYAPAAKLLQQVESTNPETALPLLEQCFSALGDYRSAYYYACKQRPGGPPGEKSVTPMGEE